MNAGLDGICVTDHVFNGLVLRHDPAHPYTGYHAVRRAAKASGLLVLPGIEFAFDEGHFLVYGLNKALLPELGEDYTLKKCLEMVNRERGIVVQAHPFRNGGRPVHGVDGIEICNGGNSDEHNQLAQEWSRENNIVGLSASDAHRGWQVGRCHTIFDADCSSVEKLCQAIRQRRVQHLKHRYSRPHS